MMSWSSTEAAVATLSGEAECKALVRGAAEALCLKAVVDELGWEMPIDIMIDSEAATSVGCWLGLGKQRHTRGEAVVWVQDSAKAVPHHQNSWHRKPRGDLEPKSIDDIRARLAACPRDSRPQRVLRTL